MSSRATSFYYFPRPAADKRNAIVAVWDFCRAVEDAVDEPGEHDPASALEQWRTEVARPVRRAEPETPQGRRLAPFIVSLRFRGGFEDLIDGVAMDLQRNRYDTFDEFAVLPARRVCGGTDWSRFRVSRFAGSRLRHRSRHRAAMDEHHPRRGPDLERGRVYIPYRDLQRSAAPKTT